MDSIKKGRIILIVMIVVTLVLRFIIDLFDILGNEGLFVFGIITGMIVFLIIGIIFLFLYEGRRWAIIISSILLGLWGIGDLIMAFLSNIILLIPAIVYIGFLILLYTNPIAAYLDFKKNEGKKTGSTQ